MHWGIRQKGKKSRSIRKAARKKRNRRIVDLAGLSIGIAALSVGTGKTFLDSHPVTLTKPVPPDTFQNQFAPVSKQAKKGARETTGHEGRIQAARGKDWVQKELGFGFGREPDR